MLPLYLPSLAVLPPSLSHGAGVCLRLSSVCYAGSRAQAVRLWLASTPIGCLSACDTAVSMKQPDTEHGCLPHREKERRGRVREAGRLTAPI